MTKIQDATEQQPRWLIKANSEEYTTDIVQKILSDMGIQHIPVIPDNSKENVLAERFNRTVTNAVRAALVTAIMSWENCQCSLHGHSQMPQINIISSPTKPLDKLPVNNVLQRTNLTLTNDIYSGNCGLHPL